MSHRARKSKGGEQRAEQLRPYKRYSINTEAMQRVSVLGTINPRDGSRSQWQPHLATEFLTELMDREEFDQEIYCDRCDEYDGELAIRPDDLELPPMRHEAARKLKLNGYLGAAWRSWKPKADVHVTPRMKSRPGCAQRLEACHMCLVSFLDEVPSPLVSNGEKRRLQGEALEAREAVFRLRRAADNPKNLPSLARLIQQMQERARKRLREAVSACHEAGFRPWRPPARRVGDAAPDQVVATEWERPAEEGEC